MSDKLKPQDGLNSGEDEELMSDFQDLIPGDESMPDLDAFLDGFEQNLDIPDVGESTLAAQRASGDALELDKSVLDLDVGLDGEIFSEEVMLDEAEASNMSGQEELVFETPTPEVIATAPAAAQIINPPSPLALSKAQLIGAAALLSSSLLLSLAALWMGMGLGSQIDIINQNVTELQQRVQAQSGRGSLAPPAQLGEQLNSLGERVNELAVIIEGPVSHLRESNQQALSALGMRLDRLEGGQVAAAQPEVTPAVTSPKAAASKPETSVAATAKQKGWVINLLSVTSAKTANSELSRLRKLGVRADKQAVNKDGKTWYRLRVSGFDSYEGAKAYIDTVQQQTGYQSAWVAKE